MLLLNGAFGIPRTGTVERVLVLAVGELAAFNAFAVANFIVGMVNRAADVPQALASFSVLGLLVGQLASNLAGAFTILSVHMVSTAVEVPRALARVEVLVLLARIGALLNALALADKVVVDMHVAAVVLRAVEDGVVEVRARAD